MTAAELIAKCFAARTAAHMAHLQTRSYAQHMALGDLYGGLGDWADAFAESYQGLFGIIEQYPDTPLPTGDALQWVLAMNKEVRAGRDTASRGKTELANQIDELLTLLNSTYYKLRNLS